MLTIISRAAVSGAQVGLRIITAELFPTLLRTSALGTCSALAAAIGISAPYLGGSLVGGLLSRHTIWIQCCNNKDFPSM